MATINLSISLKGAPGHQHVLACLLESCRINNNPVCDAYYVVQSEECDNMFEYLQNNNKMIFMMCFHNHVPSTHFPLIIFAQCISSFCITLFHKTNSRGTKWHHFIEARVISTAVKHLIKAVINFNAPNYYMFQPITEMSLVRICVIKSQKMPSNLLSSIYVTGDYQTKGKHQFEQCILDKQLKHIWMIMLTVCH